MALKVFYDFSGKGEHMQMRIGGLEGIRQDERTFVTIPERGVMPKASWMYHAYTDRPLLVWQGDQWRYIRQTFTVPTEQGASLETLEILSVDQGNDFFKFGFQTQDHRLAAIQMPSRIQVVPENQRVGSSDRTMWRSGTEARLNTTRLYVGDDARFGGRVFSVGSTAQRFEDDMYEPIIQIGLVKALKAAGHRPGTHRIALTVGVRITEVLVDEVSGKQRVNEDVVAALRRLKGTFVVEETIDGSVQVWTLIISRVFPTIQTLGTQILWSRNLLCDQVQEEFRTVGVADWGSGDFGWVIARQKRDQPLSVEGDVKADGAVQIAQAVFDAVKRNFPHLRFSLADAQQAIVDNALEVGGREWPLFLTEDLASPLEEVHGEQAQEMSKVGAHAENDRGRSTELKIISVRQAYRNAVSGLVVDATPYLKSSGLFLINTGGTLRNPLVLHRLIQRLSTFERPGDEYLIVPDQPPIPVWEPSLTPNTSNALGLYVDAYWRLMRMLPLPTTTLPY